jgi:hypothetical protein
MANGEEMLAFITEIKESRAFSIVRVVEQSLNGKVDELLELQRKVIKDLEKIIEKLSM